MKKRSPRKGLLNKSLIASFPTKVRKQLTTKYCTVNNSQSDHYLPTKKLKKHEKIYAFITQSQNPLSYSQISRRCNCSSRYVKMVIQGLIKAGKISKKSTIYEIEDEEGVVSYSGKNLYVNEKDDSNPLIINVMFQKQGYHFDEDGTPVKRVKRNSSGKTYDPSKYRNYARNKALKSIKIEAPKSTKSEAQKEPPKTFEKPKNFTTYINTKNLYKYKFAKENSPRHFSSKKPGNSDFLTHKRSVLASFGFEEHAEKAPPWWFRDLDRLKSALRLLKNKLKKKFRCQNFFKFISYLLKRGTFGYRRHVARETSLAICKPTLSRVEPMLKTPPIEEGYRGLVELHKKHNLQIDFSSMEKLLRRKFPHLTMSVRVCLKRLSWSGGEKIKNINGFLNHLVGMKEPADYLKKGQKE